MNQHSKYDVPQFNSLSVEKIQPQKFHYLNHLKWFELWAPNIQRTFSNFHILSLVWSLLLILMLIAFRIFNDISTESCVSKWSEIQLQNGTISINPKYFNHKQPINKVRNWIEIFASHFLFVFIMVNLSLKFVHESIFRPGLVYAKEVSSKKIYERIFERKNETNLYQYWFAIAKASKKNKTFFHHKT